MWLCFYCKGEIDYDHICQLIVDSIDKDEYLNHGPELIKQKRWELREYNLLSQQKRDRERKDRDGRPR